jgi:hypothetical protein
MAHETHFTDGTEITPYLATAYAEGFCEGDGASHTDQIKAWSFLCGTRFEYLLQGWFGRQIKSFIQHQYMINDGTVNWDYIADVDDDPNDEETDDESYTNMEEF